MTPTIQIEITKKDGEVYVELYTLTHKYSVYNLGGLRESLQNIDHVEFINARYAKKTNSDTILIKNQRLIEFISDSEKIKPHALPSGFHYYFSLSGDDLQNFLKNIKEHMSLIPKKEVIESTTALIDRCWRGPGAQDIAPIVSSFLFFPSEEDADSYKEQAVGRVAKCDGHTYACLIQ